ncbi:MAG TPA: TRAP transporter TatT component family protein [Bacteroidota bacterium]|nr:TRAP transporter TatT component family protein [Bacteroidota bacterium]
MKILPLLILLIFAAGGCIQQIALNSLGSVLDTGFDVINREEDLTLAQASIASDLKLLETLIARDPGNAHYLLLASMGYSSYALGFAEDDSVERAKLFYARGRDFGFRILDAGDAFRTARGQGPQEFREALRSLSRDDVPAVFWTAVGWGNSVLLNLSDPAALADLPKIEAMMEFVVRNDSTYFYGGALSFLGAYHGSRPAMFGGDPRLAKNYFHRALGISGGKFLMTYILFAKTCAVQSQDRQLFESCLTAVDTASLDRLPEARLSNAIAKKKAMILRSKTDTLF